MSTKAGALLSPAVRVRDVLRLALQSAVAGSAAFAASRFAGTGEAFLAVISAVLVLQADWDATVGKAGWRLAGAVAGTLIGIAVLAVAGGGALLPLAAGMLIMGALAAWQPNLSYGLVAAAGLSVGSDAPFLETAEQRTLAIFIGTVIGIIAGIVVWPQTAGSRAARQLKVALARCSDLLEDTMNAALCDDPGKDMTAAHRSLGAALGRARDTVDAIKVGRSPRREAYQEAVHATERLWHSLIILNRVAETKSNDQLPLRERTLDRLREIRTAACRALTCASRLERIGDDDLAHIRKTNDAVWQDSRIDTDAPDELQNVALIFGIGEVLRNLCELDAAIGGIAEAR